MVYNTGEGELLGVKIIKYGFPIWYGMTRIPLYMTVYRHRGAADGDAG